MKFGSGEVSHFYQHVALLLNKMGPVITDHP